MRHETAQILKILEATQENLDYSITYTYWSRRLLSLPKTQG